jgi:hypothetical protein
MSDLAKRLRDTAGKTAFDEVRKWHVPEANRYGGVVAPMGPTEKDVGRAIVPALLREVADHISAFPLLADDEPDAGSFDDGMRTAYAQLVNTFRVWAQEIAEMPNV